jgi:hypothetical protein
MTSLYSQFKADENREKTGVVLEYGFLDKEDGTPDPTKPISIRIARAGGSNTAYTKRMEHKLKPYRRQIQTETMDTPLAEKLVREVYAETVVLGWENVTDPDGKPIPFTVENCVNLFIALPDLFKDVQEQSQRSALFRAEILERDAGN